MEVQVTTLSLGKTKLQKKHIEQMEFLSVLRWNEISSDGDIETLKCVGYVNLKEKFYIFTDNNGKIFKYDKKEWSNNTDMEKDNKASSTVYYKNYYKVLGSREEAQQFVINNTHIIRNKLNDTQIFI